MNLSDIFDKVREDNRAAFIGYYPAGFPTTGKSIENTKATADADADVIEVGLPFSDPMMDGLTIRDAINVTLDAGFRAREIMCVVHEVAEYGGICMVMDYWNPILQYRSKRFAEDLTAAGGRGTIIPDPIPEEVDQWQRAAEANGSSNIILMTPSSTNECLWLTAAASTGFVYAASHMGATDAQASVGSIAGKLVARTHEVTDAPVYVDLGVSSGGQAAEIAESTDGVIIDSALIKAAMKSTDSLIALARELAAGIRGES